MTDISNCCKAPVKVNTVDEGTSCYICSTCNNLCDLQKQITDTERLDFILDCIYKDSRVQLGFEREPHCRCGCCRSYCVDIDDKQYFADSLREAIDEAMENHK
jgi:hypothetical protein